MNKLDEENGKKMDDLTAVLIAEGELNPTTKEQYLQAWQHLVDTGTVWSLQGWFGRTAMSMIQQRLISTPKNCETFTVGMG